jgi:hypothetical protein
LESIESTAAFEHGTQISIQLKKEQSEFFSQAANLQTIRAQLGDVYSFLLRDAVPGILKDGYSAKVPAEIFVNGEQVTAKLPCIWSETRTVQSYGQEVSAVQYVNVRLTDATACLTCGHWHRVSEVSECEECGSSNLELRTRRVWGWLGVQRFIDSARYGVDFIRFGRKILKQDKSIFRFVNPDTLEEDIEYPIEMPANKGRLVGEIHIDHVPVTYQKNDFDRQHRDWAVAIEQVRGDEPLKPKSASQPNTKPLALLFSAFRRNDPGLKYLTPGDGTRALHSKAAEWGRYFDKGVPRYIEDTEWFNYAQSHQQSVDGTTPKTPTTGFTTTPSPFDEAFGTESDQPRGAESAPESTPVAQTPSSTETREQQLAKARALGHERGDLSGEFTLKHSLGTWHVKVIETQKALYTPSGSETPSTLGSAAGQKIEILVNSKHSLFLDFGRDLRDVALLQAADAIFQLARPDMPVSLLYSELATQIEDLKVTPAALAERVDGILNQIRQLMLPAIAADPEVFWELVSVADKQLISDRALDKFSNKDFQEIVDSGLFVLVAPASVISDFLSASPKDFFDNKVFKPAFSARPKSSQARLINRTTQMLNTLSDFLEDNLHRSLDDVRLTTINSELLEKLIRTDEALG